MPPRGCLAAWVLLWSSRMLVLPKLFAVVVAWPSLVTDVAFCSTSGTCCRACDAPSRMLCRVGLGGRLVVFLGGLPPRLHLPSWVLCVVATCLAGCVVWVVVEGPISLFLLFIVVLLLCFRVLTSLCGSVSRFVFAGFSASFFLMKRHVKSCLRNY
jgi:hypothetical protein